MPTSVRPLEEMSERELLETQVRLLDKIRSNTSTTLILLSIWTVLVLLSGILSVF